MPTLISRGTAAARAFGLTGSSSGQLYTQTYTSNGTFTPMTGVTNVVTLVGQGGSSSSDAPALFPDDYAITETSQSSGTPGGTPLPLAYADIASYLVNNIINVCNAGGIQTIYHTATGSSNDRYVVYPDNTYVFIAATSYPFTAYMYPGTWSLTGAGLPVPPSGSITSYASTPSGYYHATGTYQAAGAPGANSTALGQTFAGASQVGTYPTATGQAATPVTYNNLAVTPGTGYPIVVGAGGSVSISYIIP